MPHVLQAVETEAAVGAYRDALALVDAVRDHANPYDRGRLLALRANLLAAIGDRSAMDAYREALAVAAGPERRCCAPGWRSPPFGKATSTRPRPCWTAWSRTAGRPTCRSCSRRETWPTSAATSTRRRRPADRVGGLVRPEQNTWQRLDLLTLQALIAHHRGELFSRLRLELRRTQDAPALASTVFDPYLCVAEYLLYGTMPYLEVRTLAQSLRETARRSGVLRAEAFATALLGEAALLAGDIAEAERELQDAVDLHREIGAPAGEAQVAATARRGQVVAGRSARGRPAASTGAAAGAVVNARATPRPSHLRDDDPGGAGATGRASGRRPGRGHDG